MNAQCIERLEARLLRSAGDIGGTEEGDVLASIEKCSIDLT